MATKLNWTLDILKKELNSRNEIMAWIISKENVHRCERYFMMDADAILPDQDREVQSQSIELKILVHLPNKPGRQGEISQKLFPSLPLLPQIDSAVEAALQTDHQIWDLPTEVARDLALLSTTDPRMAEDLEKSMAILTDRIQNAVQKKRKTQFNSAELFLSVHHRELFLSNGLTHRSSQSRVYTEAAYSFSKSEPDGKTISDEYLNTRWAVNIDDLDIEKLFDETSERAEQSLANVKKPTTGTYSVIVDSEVLSTLFNNQISHLAAANSYNGLPFLKIGDPLISNAHGDLLTITLDPYLGFGADTTPISEQGVLQKPLRLVEQNKVIASTTDKRYADYLRIPISTNRGNVVVEPGTHSYQELTRAAPRVIEILQFSGLFADPNSGTFGSEIRLAKIYDNEKNEISFIKGGSLSGSFSENFREVRLCNQRVKHSVFSSNSSQGQGYYGPEFALLSNVSIVG